MKTIIKISFILTLILLSGLLSCGEDSNPLIESGPFTIDNFPHEIGTVWQYQLIGKAVIATDTLFVRVDDTIRITDDSLLVYVVISELSNQYRESSSESYWHIEGDTVTYYRYELGAYAIDHKVIFPLEVGSNWSSGSTPIDTNEVMNITTKTVLGRNYQNAAQIVRTAHDSQIEINDENWYAPNIGMIYSDITHKVSHLTLGGTWSLISFYQSDSLDLSDFPQQVNASWTYKVYNNLIDCAAFVDCFDTCTITILDSMMDRGGIIRSNWLFDYPEQERVINNSLDHNKLSLQWHHYPVYFSLEFPLTVGKQWFDGDVFDNSFMKVVGRETVTTEAGIFKNTFYLRGNTGGFEPGANFEIWIAKGIGIVKLTHNGAPMGSYEDKTWVLKSYDQNKPAASFTIDKFPNYDGMNWTYEVYDNISEIYDTTFVQVAESATVAMWYYTNSDSSWLEIVSLEGTVVKFFYPDNMIEPFKSYEFPIEIGNSWVTYPLGSSSSVISQTPLLVPAGRFFPCYQVASTIPCGTNCVHLEGDWICPQVGIVQKNIYNSELGINEMWRLIDYSNND